LSPLRILILIVLFYIGYRLIVGGKKKNHSTINDRTGASSAAMPATDILEEDPVCNKLVPRQQAVEYEYNGKVIYFCSKSCCKKYREQKGEH
jgi:YHS domain-containing protein